MRTYATGRGAARAGLRRGAVRYERARRRQTHQKIVRATYITAKFLILSATWYKVSSIFMHACTHTATRISAPRGAGRRVDGHRSEGARTLIEIRAEPAEPAQSAGSGHRGQEEHSRRRRPAGAGSTPSPDARRPAHRVPVVAESDDDNAVLLAQNRLVHGVSRVEVRQHVRHFGGLSAAAADVAPHRLLRVFSSSCANPLPSPLNTTATFHEVFERSHGHGPHGTSN